MKFVTAIRSISHRFYLLSVSPSHSLRLSRLINLVMNSRACCSLRARACVRDADISRDLQSFFLLQGLRHRTAANAELLLVLLLLLLLLLPTPMMLPLDLTAIRSGTRNILDGDC